MEKKPEGFYNKLLTFLILKTDITYSVKNKILCQSGSRKGALITKRKYGG